MISDDKNPKGGHEMKHPPKTSVVVTLPLRYQIASEQLAAMIRAYPTSGGLPVLSEAEQDDIIELAFDFADRLIEIGRERKEERR